jgi:hypothetical protein
MAYPVTTRNGIRYLGNGNKKEVHDLSSEDTRPQGCQIDEILQAGHAVGFRPDHITQAKAEGFDNCHDCLGGSTR